MTINNTKEQSLKTILCFLDKYVIKQPYTFTSDMYKKKDFLLLKQRLSTMLKKLDKSYKKYLKDDESNFCKTLINDVSQKYALKKGMRENTDRIQKKLCITDEDFDKLCEASDALNIFCSSIKDKTIDFIVIPGALQEGVESRMMIALKYLKEHPEFKGKILFFGSRDRKLNPFTSDGKIKEFMAFDIMADMINKSQKEITYTSKSIQTMLINEYQSLQNKSVPLKETEITEKLSELWKDKTELEWPTEYQMVYRLKRKKFKFYSTEVIETFKMISSSKTRATTQDEAVYIADKIKELSLKKKQKNSDFIPTIAVVTNYGYQIETYRNALHQQIPNFRIHMLSAYKNTKDFFSSRKKQKHLKDKTEAEIRSAFAFDILDSFSRLIFSQNHQCHFEQAVKAWSQKMHLKGRG